jgi:endonuclease YncB( thermonuclease family)
MVARLIIALICLAGAISAGDAAERLSGRTRVIDGDTIVVAGITVRLKGIAAPEVTHGGEAEELGGVEAAEFLHELAHDRTVVCELTGERTHGRRVGYCAIAGKDLGESVVRAGLARDCPRFSGGRYARNESPAAKQLPLPSYCRPR